jgi:hypothetical protein
VDSAEAEERLKKQLKEMGLTDEQITAEAEAEASAEDAEEESGDQEEGEEENEVKDNLSMFVDMADEYRLKEED